MRQDETIAELPSLQFARALWQTPRLHVLAASVAENNVGGSVPDAEGTS